jgi:hypothetical protein
MLRTTILIILCLATTAWLWVLAAALLSTGEEEEIVNLVVSIVTGAAYLAFALPAFVLALKRKLMWLGLALALLSLASVVLLA